MEARQIAKTIHQQLTYGKANLMRTWSWGMNTLQSGKDEGKNLGFLRFKVQGMKFKGWVKVSLSFDDTYKVEFIKEKRTKDPVLSELFGSTKYKFEAVTVETYEMVYFD